MDYVDPERTYPCTNCGMAPLPRAVAVGKLKALGAGAALLRETLAPAKRKAKAGKKGKKAKRAKRK